MSLTYPRNSVSENATKQFDSIYRMSYTRTINLSFYCQMLIHGHTDIFEPVNAHLASANVYILPSHTMKKTYLLESMQNIIYETDCFIIESRFVNHDAVLIKSFWPH